MKLLLSINDLSLDEIDAITRPADTASFVPQPMRGTLGLLFAQPSLRTMSSFAAAGIRVGLAPIQLTSTGDGLKDNSDFHDEIVQLSLTSNCVVVRSSQILDRKLLSNCNTAIVNAGDQRNEHPTQALSDITVMRQTGLNGATVAIIGNLKNQRTTHSLLMALDRLEVKTRLISPFELRMPEKYIGKHSEFIYTEKKEEVDYALKDADFIYIPPLGYWGVPDIDYSQAYGFDLERARSVLKSTARLMHPFPRFMEIDKTLDLTTFDAYRLQTKVGPSTREKILNLIMQP